MTGRELAIEALIDLDPRGPIYRINRMLVSFFSMLIIPYKHTVAEVHSDSFSNAISFNVISSFFSILGNDFESFYLLIPCPRREL